MIAHIILFRPRGDLPPDAWTAFAQALAAAWRDIPSIRRFRVGRRIRLGSDYERSMTEDFPYAAVIEFDDERGLREYLGHPSHEEVGRRFGASSAAALAYDYEMVEPERLEELLDR
jgi:hypothetical protein